MREPWRRLFDIAFAAGVLIVTSPVLVAAMLWVKRETPGGIFYRQQRVGKGGREFEMLKLRTMVSGAELMGAGLAVDVGDARITRSGKLLRRTSIDELPNLINVLLGDMSVIGPRPTVPSQVAQYTERQHRRHDVKPGITGWAQIHGRASVPWSQRIELDVQYVEERSLRMDLRILALTPRSMLSSAGIYKGDTGGWDGPKTD